MVYDASFNYLYMTDIFIIANEWRLLTQDLRFAKKYVIRLRAQIINENDNKQWIYMDGSILTRLT